MTEQKFVLTFAVIDVPAGQTICPASDDMHQIAYVETGTANFNNSLFGVGEGQYSHSACDITAKTDARIAVWLLRHNDDASLHSEVTVVREMRNGVDLAPGNWIMRLDTVDFPPGSRAYRHDHSGAGTRYLLEGSLEIVSDHDRTMMHPGDPWFEGTRSAVLAIADKDIPSKFVRVMILPEEDLGKRTINYLDPADDDEPRLQTNNRMIDQVIKV